MLIERLMERLIERLIERLFEKLKVTPIIFQYAFCCIRSYWHLESATLHITKNTPN